MATITQLRSEAKKQYQRGKGRKDLKGYSRMDKATLERLLGGGADDRRSQKSQTNLDKRVGSAVSSASADIGKNEKLKAQILAEIRKDVDAAREKNPSISQQELRKVAAKALGRELSYIRGEAKRPDPVKAEEKPKAKRTRKPKAEKPTPVEQPKENKSKPVSSEVKDTLSVTGELPGGFKSGGSEAGLSKWANHDIEKYREIYRKRADRGRYDYDVAQGFKPSGAEPPRLTEEELRILDNRNIIDDIRSYPGRGKNFRGITDANGNLQAGAIVKNRKSEMYVELLATAPWNVSGDDKRRTKGAGTAMMTDIIREAVAGNKKVSLQALDGAKSFYEKIGFVQKGVKDNLPYMELSPDAGRKFLGMVSDTDKGPEPKKSRKPKTKTSQQPTASAPTENKLSSSRYDATAQKSIDEWNSIASKDPELSANFSVVKEIKKTAKSSNFVGVKDSKGNLQAAATFMEEDDHLYLDYLATAPWNVKGKDSRAVKGAGTSAMEMLIKTSFAKGYGGRIKLDTLPGAKSFYEKIGFIVPNPKGAPNEMELTPSAAMEFLNKRGMKL